MNFAEPLKSLKSNLVKSHSLDKELIISLTSYPKRFNILPVAIQSLLNQSIMPDRIILWLYKDDYKSLPSSIKDFESFGLQILLIDKIYKSYTKLLPTLINFPDSFIVTCDDDILYKPTLLEELVECYERIGGIISQRAHIIQFNNKGKILPYTKWIEKTPPKNFFEINSALVFPTTGGGTLYPPNCFYNGVLDINKALELCPNADDIWFFFMASLNNTKSSLIGGRHFISLNKNSKNTLWELNRDGGNDRQLASLINEFGMPNSLENEINKACKNLTYPNTIKLRNGKCIKTKSSDVDHIGKIISETQLYYEDDLIEYIKRFFLPIRVVDVGANIGNHALGYAGHPDYKVICFEPEAELAKIAETNLKMNSIDHKIFKQYLGKKDDELPVKLMDDFIPKEFGVDLLKIDIKAFELDILLGAAKTIKLNEPILVIKHYDYSHYLSCKDFIYEFGYRPLKVFCSTPTFIYVKNKAEISDMKISKSIWVDC